MKNLLDLFDKYTCELSRGTESMADFLERNFESYIKDLRELDDEKDNELLGVETYKKIKNYISDIEQDANLIVDIFRQYSNGNIFDAMKTSFELFERMKPYLMMTCSGLKRKLVYYRIRPVDANPFSLERKELFHIPRNKNYLVKSARYSMPGHPCLYLASMPMLAWFECGKPKHFAIAKFEIPQEKENHMKFVDFSENRRMLKSFFYNWFSNTKDKEHAQQYLLKHIYTYPLRAACSVSVEHKNGSFIEEYIISQFLLQWVRNDDYFDGICYETCVCSDKKNNNSNRLDPRTLYGYNVVLVTKSFDIEGYDTKLRECVKVGLPIINNFIDIDYDSLNRDDVEFMTKFLSIEKISDDYQNI